MTGLAARGVVGESEEVQRGSAGILSHCGGAESGLRRVGVPASACSLTEMLLRCNCGSGLSSESGGCTRRSGGADTEMCPKYSIKLGERMGSVSGCSSGTSSQRSSSGSEE